MEFSSNYPPCHRLITISSPNLSTPVPYVITCPSLSVAARMSLSATALLPYPILLLSQGCSTGAMDGSDDQGDGHIPDEYMFGQHIFPNSGRPSSALRVGLPRPPHVASSATYGTPLAPPPLQRASTFGLLRRTPTFGLLWCALGASSYGAPPISVSSAQF